MIAADVRCADILRELTGAIVVEIGVYVGRLCSREVRIGANYTWFITKE